MATVPVYGNKIQRYTITTITTIQLSPAGGPRTIAAAAGCQDVGGGCVAGAGAQGVQAVEGVLPDAPRRRQRVAALRVPAVDVPAVPDAAGLGAGFLLETHIYINIYKSIKIYLFLSLIYSI